MLSKINPNWLSASRPVSAPIAMILLTIGSQTALIAYIVFMTAVELTDKLDGWIARKYGKQTAFGSLFDPVCDTACHLLIYLCFVSLLGPIMMWLVAIIMFRELTVVAIRYYCMLNNVVMGAMVIGKIKTGMQIASQFALALAFLSRHYLSPGDFTCVFGVAYAIMILTVAITLISLVEYARFGYGVYKRQAI